MGRCNNIVSHYTHQNTNFLDLATKPDVCSIFTDKNNIHTNIERGINIVSHYTRHNANLSNFTAERDEVPHGRKQVCVHRIFKKGDCNIQADHRPISLISVCSDIANISKFWRLTPYRQINSTDSIKDGAMRVGLFLHIEISPELAKDKTQMLSSCTSAKPLIRPLTNA